MDWYSKPPVSYYDVLGITPQADDAEIKKAYHRLALQFHPDRNPKKKNLAQLRFQTISEAYKALKTADKREMYNRNMQRKKLPLKEKTAYQNDNIQSTSPSWISQISKALWPKS